MVVKSKPTPRADRARRDADEVNAALEKKFGRNIIIKGADLKGLIIPRASTGSLSFDIMYQGGFPLNQWNEIIGMQSSGKSAMIMETVAEQQRLNPDYEVMWVASEPFVHQWATQIGMDVDRVTIVETNVMEEAYETVIEYLDNRLVDCIVIDSFPALVPSEENDNGMDDWQVGLGARLTGKFFRKQSPASKRSLRPADEDRDCLLLIVNQWRDKIGVMFGDPRTTPGGKAKDFFYFTRTEMAKDEWIIADTTSKRRVGMRMRAHTIKNKSAPVERVGYADFYFDTMDGQIPGRYDIGKDLFTSGIHTAVIDKRGSMYDFGGYTWRSKENVMAAFREDLDLRNLIRFEVLRAIGVEDLVEPTPTKAKAVKQRPAARRAIAVAADPPVSIRRFVKR